MTVAIVAGVVVLAAIGALIGWSVTTSPAHPTAAGVTPSLPAPAAAGSSPSTSLPGRAPGGPSAPASGTSGPSGSASVAGPVIPPYAASQTNFIVARDQLRTMRLGVNLVFVGPRAGVPDGAVVDSKPPAGTAATPGLTVNLFVAGNPPPLAMLAPATGETCAAFGKRLAAASFRPVYVPRKFGLVAAADPDFGSASTWNAKVTLTCTEDGQLPPPPPPSSPAAAP